MAKAPGHSRSSDDVWLIRAIVGKCRPRRRIAAAICIASTDSKATCPAALRPCACATLAGDRQIVSAWRKLANAPRNCPRRILHCGKIHERIGQLQIVGSEYVAIRGQCFFETRLSRGVIARLAIDFGEIHQSRRQISRRRRRSTLPIVGRFGQQRPGGFPIVGLRKNAPNVLLARTSAGSSAQSIVCNSASSLREAITPSFQFSNCTAVSCSPCKHCN